jgi:hypothetical protein
VLPDVVVEHEGSAPLDGDEYVVALRATQLAERLAWNSGDFTINALTESTTAHGIKRVYEHYRAYTFREVELESYAGPPIWAPISVAVDGSEVAVQVCLASQDRSISESSAETRYDLEDGRVVTWFLAVQDDGLVEVDRMAGTQDECDASAAEVLSFDPVPTPPVKITEGDIRKPAAG